MLWLHWCSVLRRKCDTFCGAHTDTLDCGAVKPQHNDPQLLVSRELLSAGQNKVLTPYACSSRTSSIFQYLIRTNQSHLHALYED